MPDNLLFTFLKIAAEVKKDQPIDLNVNMKPFVEDKIFQEVKEIPSGRYTFYKVTPFGELAIKYAQERNDNRVNPMDSDYLA